MLDIRIKPIESCGEALSNTGLQVSEEAADLESVISALSAIEGLGDYAGAVRKQLQMLDEERQDIYKLSQGLGKIAAQYNKSEADILDETDGCKVTYSQREIKTIAVAPYYVGGRRLVWNNRKAGNE